jgi:hypothetical protein
VEYGSGRLSTLRHDPLPTLSRFTAFFAAPASHCERKGPQSRFWDILAALQAAAIASLLEPPKREHDLGQCFRLHLDEGELHLFLTIGFRALAFVEDLAFVEVVGSRVTLPIPHLVDKLNAAVVEHRFEMPVATGFGGCVGMCRHSAGHSFLTSIGQVSSDSPGLLFAGLSPRLDGHREASRANLLTVEDMYLLSFVSESGDP